MADVDFRRFLLEQPDVDRREVTDQMWADMGRRMYQNLMDEKFVKALVNAQLAAVNNGKNEPVHQGIARRIRAFIFSGTISQ